MEPHEIVSGRFEIQALAGSGGMGAVYRALDRTTGSPVAIKVLLGHGGDHAERFAREARLLSELRHPGIVRFVANGTTASGEGYLAMEWLEGESLSARLARGPLSVTETLVIGSRVADALTVAHDRGIVHRDLKPGNLFLVQGAIERVMVLDFGIARVLEPGQTLTRTGAMLGTPGYMSPEQSRGEKDVDARTDIFALGCVLFKCLAGRSAFEGTDPLSVTLKMMLDPTPRVAGLRPDVPPAVDDLVDRMLAKARQDRPQSAAALKAELGAIAAGAPTAGARPAGARGAGAPAPAGRAVVLARAQRGAVPAPMGLSLSVVLAREEQVRAAVAPHGGTLQPLADGSLLVTLHGGAGSAGDVESAARCALAIQPLLPGMTLALIADLAAGPAGTATAIDRGVGLLAASGGPVIRVDAAAVSLLSARFEIAAVAGGHELRGERRAPAPPPAPTISAVSSVPAVSFASAAPAGWAPPASSPGLPPAPTATSSAGWAPPREAAIAAAATTTLRSEGHAQPRRGNALLVASLAAAILALAAVVIVLVVFLPGSSRSSGSPGSPGADTAQPTSSDCPAEKCLPIRAADLLHVDVIDLLPQARRIAASVDSSATLVLVNATTPSGDGTVDVTKPNYSVSFQFQSKSGSIQVTHWGSKLIATHVGVPVTGRPLGDPTCSARAAWKAALSKGAPRSGTAMLNLTDPGPPLGTGWTIIAGGANYQIDARTCAPRR